MEDLESILKSNNPSTVLNILDGVNSFDNIVFLATTNYPEELESRIKNRPSRFDRRFYIGPPEKWHVKNF
ncbi:MAG: AAA family ATPase [Thioploca sp.]|nr:AAA family ATPase [Thioploca sp.]